MENPFDSDEERWFYYWCVELLEAGYIKEFIHQPQSFRLANEVRHTIVKPMKRVEDKLLSKILLEDKVYTPDFKIIWSGVNHFHLPKATLLQCSLIKEFISGKIISEREKLSDASYAFVSYIEIKPDFDQNNMTREFKINQKWMYQKYGIYINLIIPTKKNKPKINWFQQTFTPEAFKEEQTYSRSYQSFKPGDTKLKYKPRSLEQFLFQLKLNEQYANRTG